MLSRRGLITGLISLAAAPAIVRASSLMPVKMILPADPLAATISPSQYQALLNVRMNAAYELLAKQMREYLYSDTSSPNLLGALFDGR